HPRWAPRPRAPHSGSPRGGRAAVGLGSVVTVEPPAPPTSRAVPRARGRGSRIHSAPPPASPCHRLPTLWPARRRVLVPVVAVHALALSARAYQGPRKGVKARFANRSAILDSTGARTGRGGEGRGFSGRR